LGLEPLKTPSNMNLQAELFHVATSVTSGNNSEHIVAADYCNTNSMYQPNTENNQVPAKRTLLEASSNSNSFDDQKQKRMCLDEQTVAAADFHMFSVD
jgi:hypothetical protein